MERRSLRALPLISLLVRGRMSLLWVASISDSAWLRGVGGPPGQSRACYSFNARGIARDGEASVPMLTASLGFRQHSAAA